MSGLVRDQGPSRFLAVESLVTRAGMEFCTALDTRQSLALCDTLWYTRRPRGCGRIDAYRSRQIVQWKVETGIQSRRL